LLGILRGRWLVRRTPADLAMAAFAIACIVSTAAGGGRSESFVALRKLLLLPLVHLAAGALRTPARVRTALRLFVFGIAATALVAMLRFVLHQHAADARLRST